MLYYKRDLTERVIRLKGDNYSKLRIAVPFFGYSLFFWRKIMQTRVAVMAIIVEEPEAVEKLNSILHDYGKYIIGRMGIPYREKGINIISIALDAPQDSISSLAGKLGNISGLSVKTAYSNVIGND